MSQIELTTSPIVYFRNVRLEAIDTHTSITLENEIYGLIKFENQSYDTKELGSLIPN